jgi:hypothetical protein
MKLILLNRAIEHKLLLKENKTAYILQPNGKGQLYSIAYSRTEILGHGEYDEKVTI